MEAVRVRHSRFWYDQWAIQTQQTGTHLWDEARQIVQQWEASNVWGGTIAPTPAPEVPHSVTILEALTLFARA
jgi:hypothetical protein